VEMQRRDDVAFSVGSGVPAAMTILGKWNWYLPSWLNWLPELHVEGDPESLSPPAEAPGAPPTTPISV